VAEVNRSFKGVNTIHTAIIVRSKKIKFFLFIYSIIGFVGLLGLLLMVGGWRSALLEVRGNVK
jgi:hypothetical protein